MTETRRGPEVGGSVLNHPPGVVAVAAGKGRVDRGQVGRVWGWGTVTHLLVVCWKKRKERGGERKRDEDLYKQ